MISLPSDITQQRLISAMGGVALACYLFFMIQVLSAVQTSSSDNQPMLVLNLLELPQTQISVKPVKKIQKPEPVKPQPKKKTQKITPIKSSAPDLSNLSQEPETVAESNTEETSLPTPVPYFKLSDLPRFLHQETPVYPENMRASGNTGIVELVVLIDKTGKVRQITIIKSAGEYFDQAAIDAINASSFVPAKVEGKPVSALLKMPVKFKLL
ncbi:MAG: energy transducer TonB [Gammaproteobacteria bacterium]